MGVRYNPQTGLLDDVGLSETGDTATGAYTFNSAQDATSDFTVKGDTDASLFVVDVSADCVGIGTSGPTSKLHTVGSSAASGNHFGNNMGYTTTATDGASKVGLYVTSTSRATAASTATLIGIQGSSSTSSANAYNLTGLNGLRFTCEHNAATTVALARSVWGYSYNWRAGTITTSEQFYTNAWNNSGRITNWNGLSIGAPSLGSSAIGTLKAIKIASQAAAGTRAITLTNIVGVAGTVTVTKTNHYFITGDSAVVTGTTNYNGTYTITVTDANTFTFAKAGDIAQETTGTVTVTGVITNTPYAISQEGVADINYFAGRMDFVGTDSVTVGRTYVDGTQALLAYKASASASDTLYGVNAEGRQTVNKTSGSMIGFQAYGQTSLNGSIAMSGTSTLRGFKGGARNQGTGTVALATGVDAQVEQSNATGTITDARAISASIINAGTITTATGLYIPALTGTTNYGIQQIGVNDLNVFAGTVASKGFLVGATAGVDGSFTSADGKTITVTKGIITAIV